MENDEIRTPTREHPSVPAAKEEACGLAVAREDPPGVQPAEPPVRKEPGVHRMGPVPVAWVDLETVDGTDSDGVPVQFVVVTIYYQAATVPLVKPAGAKRYKFVAQLGRLVTTTPADASGGLVRDYRQWTLKSTPDMAMVALATVQVPNRCDVEAGDAVDRGDVIMEPGLSQLRLGYRRLVVSGRLPLGAWDCDGALPADVSGGGSFSDGPAVGLMAGVTLLVPREVRDDGDGSGLSRVPPQSQTGTPGSAEPPEDPGAPVSPAS